MRENCEKDHRWVIFKPDYLSMCDSLNGIIYYKEYVYGIWDIMDIDFLYFKIYMLEFLAILCPVNVA